jgi:hypothetical protein
MARRSPPRLAGNALRALAATLRAPLAGRALAQIAVRQMGLEGFRRAHVPDAEMRPAITFRPGIPKPPTDDD